MEIRIRESFVFDEQDQVALVQQGFSKEIALLHAWSGNLEVFYLRAGAKQGVRLCAACAQDGTVYIGTSPWDVLVKARSVVREDIRRMLRRAANRLLGTSGNLQRLWEAMPGHFFDPGRVQHNMALWKRYEECKADDELGLLGDINPEVLNPQKVEHLLKEEGQGKWYHISPTSQDWGDWWSRSPWAIEVPGDELPMYLKESDPQAKAWVIAEGVYVIFSDGTGTLVSRRDFFKGSEEALPEPLEFTVKG